MRSRIRDRNGMVSGEGRERHPLTSLSFLSRPSPHTPHPTLASFSLSSPCYARGADIGAAGRTVGGRQRIQPGGSPIHPPDVRD